MSGSPVYAADGRLIGAVAYGLAGASTIAGITPAADMYTQVGVYRRGLWLLNRDLFSGNILRTFSFGSATGRPVVWG
jgi:hypothetical protein